MAAQTAAERLSSRGSGAVKLPVSGEEVLFHVPRTRPLMEAAMFPLVLSTMDMKDVDPDEREHLLEQADRNGVKLIVACCYSPRFTERAQARPGRDECPVDSLVPDDYAALIQAIMDKIADAYTKPDTQAAHEEDNMRAIALACRLFGVDPTEVDDWEACRAQRLIEYAQLVAERQ